MNYVWTCVRSAWGGSTFTKISYNDPYPGHCARESCYSYNKRYGQGSIKSCATPACGVGAYRNCQTEGCGRTPNSCRTSACGCERGNDCTLNEQQYHYYYCHRTGNTGGKGDLNGSTCTFN